MSDLARIHAPRGDDGTAVARAFAYLFSTSASWARSASIPIVEFRHGCTPHPVASVSYRLYNRTLRQPNRLARCRFYLLFAAPWSDALPPHQIVSTSRLPEPRSAGRSGLTPAATSAASIARTRLQSRIVAGICDVAPVSTVNCAAPSPILS